MFERKLIFYFLASIIFCLSGCSSAFQKKAEPQNKIVSKLSKLSRDHSNIFQLSDLDRPGSWCWFQDQRVIMDTKNPDKPILITGVVTYGDSLSDQRRDVDLYWAELDPDAKNPLLKRERIELDDQLQMDDHASPSFLIRPDDRYLVNWFTHGNDKYIRTKISINSHDPSSWSETIKSSPSNSGVTYTNPNFLANANDGKGIIFNGIRLGALILTS